MANDVIKQYWAKIESGIPIAVACANCDKVIGKGTFGFHNATGPHEKMALAVDLLDDDNPLDSPIRYLLALAIAARDNGLTTGILWHRKGQPALAEAEAAIAARNIDANVHVGWDPTHVEVVGVSLTEAEGGDFSKVA